MKVMPFTGSRRKACEIPIGRGRRLHRAGGITEIPIVGDRVAEAVCERAGRTLTEQEWEQHLAGVPYRDICPTS